MTNPLLQPFDLKGLHLPNRIVMAPMTRSFSPGGIPGDNVAAYYRRRAEGEVGLIVTEGTVIEQFFWEGTNVREDGWNGRGLPLRARFAAEILQAVRLAVGPDFPVIIRRSQWKQQICEVKLTADPKALEAWLWPLADAGADVSTARSGASGSPSSQAPASISPAGRRR